jgi:hypothetical protein
VKKKYLVISFLCLVMLLAFPMNVSADGTPEPEAFYISIVVENVDNEIVDSSYVFSCMSNYENRQEMETWSYIGEGKHISHFLYYEGDSINVVYGGEGHYQQKDVLVVPYAGPYTEDIVELSLPPLEKISQDMDVFLDLDSSSIYDARMYLRIANNDKNSMFGTQGYIDLKKYFENFNKEESRYCAYNGPVIMVQAKHDNYMAMMRGYDYEIYDAVRFTYVYNFNPLRNDGDLEFDPESLFLIHGDMIFGQRNTNITVKIFDAIPAHWLVQGYIPDLGEPNVFINSTDCTFKTNGSFVEYVEQTVPPTFIYYQEIELVHVVGGYDSIPSVIPRNSIIDGVFTLGIVIIGITGVAVLFTVYKNTKRHQKKKSKRVVEMSAETYRVYSSQLGKEMNDIREEIPRLVKEVVDKELNRKCCKNGRD